MYRWILCRLFRLAGRELSRIKRAEIARYNREMDARYDLEYWNMLNTK